MIIVTRTAYSLVRLLVNSFAAGAVLYSIYALLASFPVILKCADKAKVGFADFRKSVSATKCNGILLASCDFTVCIIATCAVYVLLFIYNNGQFRLIAVAAVCVGFYCTKLLFSKALTFIIRIIAFCLLKMILTVSLPFVWLVNLLVSAVRRALTRLRKKHNLSLMKKYTKERFEKLDALTEFGLIDESFKELLK